MKSIHVVAAVIYDVTQERILLAKRPDDKHQGGKWEFPGGKIETQETIIDALTRELEEELAIQVTQAQPLIQIHHDYGDKAVFLDIWQVNAFTGEPQGAEGQTIKWVNKTKLNDYRFPDANVPILQAIALPNACLITPEPTATLHFLSTLEQALQKGISLLQFRAKGLDADNYCQLAQQVIDKAHAYDAKVILNSPPTPTILRQSDGLHLTSQQLMSSSASDIMLTHQQTLSASCHSLAELAQAKHLNTDFVMLSPVQKTSSHPDAKAMGWDVFYTATKTINCPVYALGGLGYDDIPQAKRHGAQGIAAITQLWK